MGAASVTCHCSGHHGHIHMPQLSLSNGKWQLQESTRCYLAQSSLLYIWYILSAISDSE